MFKAFFKALRVATYEVLNGGYLSDFLYVFKEWYVYELLNTTELRGVLLDNVKEHLL